MLLKDNSFYLFAAIFFPLFYTFLQAPSIAFLPNLKNKH
ncbi:hypothetical protein LRLP16767_LR202_00216 [Limosilactobacillus reuteri]|uniref:Uncharacterized protein n=1 Tax=Limosilactobacillus reuteri TaxID=1598 RepID=A0A0U5JRX5_LIMRT|nr:hypothetical protein LRLP16767_LR202_00216 [Limosilactobacillus reuteri]